MPYLPEKYLRILRKYGYESFEEMKRDADKRHVEWARVLAAREDELFNTVLKGKRNQAPVVSDKESSPDETEAATSDDDWKLRIPKRPHTYWLLSGDDADRPNAKRHKKDQAQNENDDPDNARLDLFYGLTGAGSSEDEEDPACDDEGKDNGSDDTKSRQGESCESGSIDDFAGKSEHEDGDVESWLKRRMDPHEPEVRRRREPEVRQQRGDQDDGGNKDGGNESGDENRG